MNIVLIGMRGSGKTTVGRILAEKLGRPLVEADRLITERAGLTVPEIVEKHGWAVFRDIEEEITAEVSGMDGIVHATGGGVVTRQGNITGLEKNGVLVWLRASVDSLLERIGDGLDRPPLAGGRTPRQDMEITYMEREALYRQAADYIIDTENKTPAAVAEEIIGLLKQQDTGTMVSGGTRVCCLIGDPVEHSLSPLIHNAGYRALGLDFTYIPFRVKDIKPAIEGIRGLGIRGASVTIPHKVTAMDYVDAVDPAAGEIGAINTIINNDGRLTGFNTDCPAAVAALAEVTGLEGKGVVIIGSGGAARAIAVGLRGKSDRLAIINRTAEKARDLAELAGAADCGGLDRLPLVSTADIVINTTSVGMWPRTGESIIPAALLDRKHVIFDIVYNPRETRLLTEARGKGCTVVYGYKMLLYQAAMQFEMFTGHKAPLPVMERALTGALG